MNLLLHTINLVKIYGVRLGFNRFLAKSVEHSFMKLILLFSSTYVNLVRNIFCKHSRVVFKNLLLGTLSINL